MSSAEDPHDIYHWFRLDARVTTSGQPTAAQLAVLRDLGVQHVVNLALHDSPRALPNEAATCAALGLTYTHIPVDFQNPTDADFQRFSEVMQALSSDKLHVHCAANYRVAAFLYRYRCQVLGTDEPTARADMQKIWQPDAIWTKFIQRSA